MKQIYTFITIFVFSFSLAQQDKKNTLQPDIHATNFRDLGGYPTNNGSFVKYNKLFRSGELSHLTDENWTELKKLNIMNIVDFRSNDEVKKAPDHLSEGINYQQLPAGSEGLNDWQKVLFKAKSGDSLMISFYSKTDHLKDKYAPFFQTLLKEPKEQATVFHCTAGKDRTGIAAALLLYALGVSQENIMKDYLLSNVYRKDENDKMVKQMMQSGINEQVAKDIVSVKPEYLEAAYKAIVGKYGSIDKFFEKEIGLTSKDIKILKEKYTEKRNN